MRESHMDQKPNKTENKPQTERYPAITESGIQQQMNWPARHNYSLSSIQRGIVRQFLSVPGAEIISNFSFI